MVYNTYNGVGSTWAIGFPRLWAMVGFTWTDEILDETRSIFHRSFGKGA